MARLCLLVSTLKSPSSNIHAVLTLNYMTANALHGHSNVLQHWTKERRSVTIACRCIMVLWDRLHSLPSEVVGNYTDSSPKGAPGTCHRCNYPNLDIEGHFGGYKSHNKVGKVVLLLTKLIFSLPTRGICSGS
ncbi:hypothetical protein NQZ68_020347 [Dissostichus eleginoides]|nr:hypothetical protein NQZ68_020347 [Dissostichus eleginoides]